VAVRVELSGGVDGVLLGVEREPLAVLPFALAVSSAALAMKAVSVVDGSFVMQNTSVNPVGGLAFRQHTFLLVFHPPDLRLKAISNEGIGQIK